MKITINNKNVEVLDGETLIETACRVGISIPSMCYVKGAVHKSSCLVCAVKNTVTGQVIPSCTTLPTEGMQIDTESEEVRQIRTLSLELLLGNHRADCEAPCKMACPGGFDIAGMNRLYDQGKQEEALQLLRDGLVIPATLCYICNAPCEKICRKSDIDQSVTIREIKKELVATTQLDKVQKNKSNGKKVAVIGSDPAGLAAAYNLCSLGYQVVVFEKSVSPLVPYIEADKVPPHTIELEIEAIKRTGVEVVCSSPNPDLEGFAGVIATAYEHTDPAWLVLTTKTKQPARLVQEGQKLAVLLHNSISVVTTNKTTDNIPFNSTYSRFTECEKTAIRKSIQLDNRQTGCLYCDCDKKTRCKLRAYSTEYGIRKTRYPEPKEAVCHESAYPMHRQLVQGNTWFEPAKCIRCGLCVYNSHNGFTFKDRGYGMQVVLPVESVGNITEETIKLCPSGALYTIK